MTTLVTWAHIYVT